MDLEKDIYTALLLLEGMEDVNNLGNYNLIYGMTNENLCAYYKYFPMGNVLTIASSGDQILQAVCMGAKNIYAFDYNPLALYMAKLKVTFLFYMSLDKFKKYFYNEDRKSYFNEKYYDEIREYLDSDTRMFWDELYRNVRYKFQFDNLIMGANRNKNRGYYSFLNSSNYLDTKLKLGNVKINYYCSDVFDILGKLPNDIKFDSVFLSNIYDWMGLEGKVKYPLFIKKDLNNYITYGGMVAVYSSVNGSVNNALGILFEDSISVGEEDKVFVYKKRK